MNNRRKRYKIYPSCILQGGSFEIRIAEDFGDVDCVCNDVRMCYQ